MLIMARYPICYYFLACVDAVLYRLGGTTDASSTPAAAVTDVCGRLRMPDDSKLNTTRITLDDGEYTAYTKEVDGSFCFYNVGPGVHLLDVQSNHLMFSQVKVQLLKDAMNDPKFVEYPYAGAAKFPLTKLILTAHASYEFFQPKPGFSPFTMLKNPMVLMMIVSIGLMFLMPKMMEGLDPEQQEQMRQQEQQQ